ncbi:hypothetical protein HPULCUR_001404 [Helicostylum pulchrum]|uniref:Uncharacterized protein n=1 Tax=Helicostylum pulchrum TaxID=562976 RepID=A0ABP9XML1_9FUNG
MSTEAIDQLIHAIANVSHIEKPCLENLLTIKKMEIAKEPVDVEHYEAEKKVIMWENTIADLNSWSLNWVLFKVTCGLQQEKDRSEVCLKKAKQLVTETEEKVQDEKDKIHEVEVQNEKYTVEYRTLQKYREDVTLMLDEIVKGDFAGETALKEQIGQYKDKSIELFDNIKKLETVKDLLKTSDSSILEAILELRSSSSKETLMGEGKVYFPEIAFDCLKEARELYPDLPGFKSPTEYVNESDNTGAYYSPMQKYLWDVRKRLAELISWCADEAIALLDEETQTQVQLGLKVDEYNFERRRILKESA